MNITEVFKKIQETKHIDISIYEYICFFDGACLPVNPYGNMGVGSIILNKDLKEVFKYSAEKTPNRNNSNNVAEYMALKQVLLYFYENGLTDKKILILGDSNLVINQMNDEWQIKDGLYRDQAIVTKQIYENFTNLNLHWIPRELNYLADMLSREKLTMNGYKGFKLKEYNKISNTDQKVDFLIKAYMELL